MTTTLEVFQILRSLTKEKKIEKTRVKEIASCFTHIQENLEKNNLILKIDSMNETIKIKNTERKKYLEKLLLNLNTILKCYPNNIKAVIKKFSFHYYLDLKDNTKPSEKINILITEKILKLIELFYQKTSPKVISVSNFADVILMLTSKLHLKQSVPGYLFFDNCGDATLNTNIIEHKKSYIHKLKYNTAEILSDVIDFESFIQTFFNKPKTIEQTEFFVKKVIYKGFLFVLIKQKHFNSYIKDLRVVYFNFIDTSETPSTSTSIEITKNISDIIDQQFKVFHSTIINKMVLTTVINQILPKLQKEHHKFFKTYLTEQNAILNEILKTIKKI